MTIHLSQLLSYFNASKEKTILNFQREKEKNKPLEFESDEDETPVLTFKNKDKKRCKEIEANMD